MLVLSKQACIGSKSCSNPSYCKVAASSPPDPVIALRKVLSLFRDTRMDVKNTELKDLRKIICLRKSEVYINKKQKKQTKNQFLMSKKIWWSMAFTACHAPIKMTPKIYLHSNYDFTIDVRATSSRPHSIKGLSKTFDNSVVATVTSMTSLV